MKRGPYSSPSSSRSLCVLFKSRFLPSCLNGARELILVWVHLAAATQRHLPNIVTGVKVSSI